MSERSEFPRRFDPPTAKGTAKAAGRSGTRPGDRTIDRESESGGICISRYDSKQQKTRQKPGFCLEHRDPLMRRCRDQGRSYGSDSDSDSDSEDYAAMPLWRSRASMLGSRPRKARKFSAAGRLPPRLMISARKR